jgi:hypothetical protein
VCQQKIWQLNLWLPKNVAVEKAMLENYGHQNCGDEKVYWD